MLEGETADKDVAAGGRQGFARQGMRDELVGLGGVGWWRTIRKELLIYKETYVYCTMLRASRGADRPLWPGFCLRIGRVFLHLLRAGHFLQHSATQQHTGRMSKLDGCKNDGRVKSTLRMFWSVLVHKLHVATHTRMRSKQQLIR